MRICFIGSGYVGLVSGAALADIGHNVTCIDNELEKIEKLKASISPIFEPGLDQMLAHNLSNGRLSFTHRINIEIQNYEVIFIAVNTPSAVDGSADLSYVYSALDTLIAYILPNQIIVMKSTVPPGTVNNIKEYLKAKNINNEIVSNPEFLREGFAIEDFLNPDRVVIGTFTENARQIMRKIYQPLLERGAKFVATDPTTSELIKYASNSFLALKVGFINEMANICEAIGANINMLSYGMGLDSRIGDKFLKAGPGFGGSCFPKDILAISYLAQHLNEPCSIIDAVISSNDKRKHLMVEKIIRALRGNLSDRTVSGNLQDKTICALGVTFKANTDDVRSSPAIEILKLLVERKAHIKAFDPAGMYNAKSLLPEIEFHSSIIEAAEQADCILILTEWSEFSKFDYISLKNILRDKLIIDLRNILDKDIIEAQGFKYVCVGV